MQDHFLLHNLSKIRRSSDGSLSAYVDGFSLHAGVNIRSHRRDALEKLIGYVARPSLSVKRLSETDKGDIKYKFKKM